MKTCMKIFVAATLAVTMSFLTGCGTTSKLQKAAENFGYGKTFFESYNINTDGTYIAGRIVFAERKIFNDNYAVKIKLDNGKTFMIARDEVYNSSPILFLTEESKPLHRDEPNTYDAETVKDLYVEAIVNDGISHLFVYYNYADHQRAQAFLKKGTKPETKESSLDIKDEKYRKVKGYVGAKQAGKRSVVEIVNYFGVSNFSCYYMRDGNVLSLRVSTQEIFVEHGRQLIQKGNTLSYILSDMDGIEATDNPYTNIIDYKVE